MTLGKEKILRQLYDFRKSGYSFIIISSLIVGLVTGGLAVIFIKSIEWLTVFLKGLAASDGWWLIMLFPVAGGLLVGLITRYFAPEAKGHGIPEVMLSVAINRGIIRPVVVIAKSLSSIITIGTGCSVGREGPVAQIGAGVGSTFAQIMRLGESRTITLLGAGAAAGIAATFNAPISGVMFATEVILKKTSVKEFSALVVAAVSSSVVSHTFLGNDPAFKIPQYNMRCDEELLLYVLLGAICALVGVSFIKSLFFFEKFFDDKLKSVPGTIKPALGGLVMGGMLLMLPQLYGGGFPIVEEALTDNIDFKILAILIFAKMLATSICIGSGSSGGVFAPCLFIGAMTGGTFGKIAAVIFPGITGSSGGYAIIGMAAVFAACDRAPVTAILLLFEMTRNYQMILPLMFATVISVLLAEWMYKESIYTCKLTARGIDLKESDNRPLIEIVQVEDAMEAFSGIFKVPPYLHLRDLEAHFHQYDQRRALVVNSSDKLVGIVTIKDLYSSSDKLETGIVADICTCKLTTLKPGDSLADASVIFGTENFEAIPVVSHSDPKECLGVLSKSDLANAYSKCLMDKAMKIKYLNKLKFKRSNLSEFVEYSLSGDDAACGKKISDLSLPENCNIVAIYRGPEIVTPRGSTELFPGDNLLAITNDEEGFIAAVRAVN